MAFFVDLRDIQFNLFEYLKIDKDCHLDISDLKEIHNQFIKFVTDKIFPTRVDGDQIGVSLTDKGVIVPDSFKSAASDYYKNGWFGMYFKENLGGMDLPEAFIASCTSILTSANISMSIYFILSKGVIEVISHVASENIKNKFIPSLIEGRWGGTMCLTEAGAGSDVGAISTMATHAKDDIYNIKGQKIFISGGDNNLYENIIHLVLARTPDSPEGSKGLSIFVVPKYLINDDGSIGELNNVKCTKVEEKMGIHGSSTCELLFGSDGPCKGYLLGKEGEGIIHMFMMMNEARIYCGLQGESQASLVYELTKKYVHERSQFNKEIIQHPDVKQTVLKMRAMSRGLRCFIFYISSLIDKKQMEYLSLLTPICKAYCSDEGFNTCVDAVQMHGGYGYCREYSIEQALRDAKISSIYEGTNGIQAIDFVMRKIIKDEGNTFNKLLSEINSDLSNKVESIWPKEIADMKFFIGQTKSILELLAKCMKENKSNIVLTHSTSFLAYCGNLIIAWQLLRSALVSKEFIQSANNEDKSFYNSKIDDYLIFCRFYLSKNLSIAHSILNYDMDICSIEV